MIQLDQLCTKVAKFIQPLTGYDWGPIESTNAGLVVNVWGDKDPFAKIGATGYRSTMGGYSVNNSESPLFNIEIKGADHTDYVYGIDLTKTGDALERNEKISAYVARFVLSAKDPETFKAYLAELTGQKKLIPIAQNSYRLVIL